MSSSNVGNASTYEAGDQRNKTNDQIDQEKSEARFHEGKEHSHKAQDSKDERSIANKLERETKRDGDIADEEDTEEVKALKKDPTAPAKMHGNEPSKGAKIDLQLQLEEEAELKKKGKA